MKRVLYWAGGVLVALIVLGASAHAATSAEAHAAGQCVFCNLHECLYAMFHS
jgi:hypothetical protein